MCMYFVMYIDNKFKAEKKKKKVKSIYKKKNP